MKPNLCSKCGLPITEKHHKHFSVMFIHPHCLNPGKRYNQKRNRIKNRIVLKKKKG